MIFGDCECGNFFYWISASVHSESDQNPRCKKRKFENNSSLRHQVGDWATAIECASVGFQPMLSSLDEEGCPAFFPGLPSFVDKLPKSAVADPVILMGFSFGFAGAPTTAGRCRSPAGLHSWGVSLYPLFRQLLYFRIRPHQRCLVRWPIIWLDRCFEVTKSSVSLLHCYLILGCCRFSDFLQLSLQGILFIRLRCRDFDVDQGLV